MNWSIKLYKSKGIFLKKQWSQLLHFGWFSRELDKFSGCADPFLFIHESNIYLFFEAIVNNKGEIWAAEYNDGKLVSYNNIISEKFHLSYPFIFKYEEAFYMVPESHEDYSVRLYKSSNFPFTWKLDHLLIHEKTFADTNLIISEGVFYWFTFDMGTNACRLYYVASLKGEWIEHIKSPVGFCRNGGDFIYHDNYILRPVQISKKSYGEGLKLMKIVVLSVEDYVEEEYINPFLEKRNGFSLNGTHHISIANFKNNKLIAVDGRNLNFYKLV